MRRTWQTIYGTTLTGAATGAGIVITSLFTGSITWSIAGLSLLFVSVIAFRVAYEQGCLASGRRELGRQERTLEAERGVLELETERARRELDDRERANAEALANERAQLCRQLQEERERMQTEFENERATLRNDAFSIGLYMGQNGIAEEARPAEVINLFPAGVATMMGTGNMHN